MSENVRVVCAYGNWSDDLPALLLHNECGAILLHVSTHSCGARYENIFNIHLQPLPVRVSFLMILRCVNCDKEYRPGYLMQSFCSPDCAQEAHGVYDKAATSLMISIEKSLQEPLSDRVKEEAKRIAEETQQAADLYNAKLDAQARALRIVQERNDKVAAFGSFTAIACYLIGVGIGIILKTFADLMFP